MKSKLKVEKLILLLIFRALLEMPLVRSAESGFCE